MNASPDYQSGQAEPQELFAGVRIITPEQDKLVEVRQTLPLVEVTFEVPLRFFWGAAKEFAPVMPQFVLGCREAGVHPPEEQPPADSTTYNRTTGVVTASIQTAKVIAKVPGCENVVIVWVKKADGRWSVSQEVGFPTKVIP